MEKPSFLLIDDQEDNIVSLKAIIDNLYPDCEIISATSGMKGIELAVLHKPNIIVLDIQMPQMDGFAVCEALIKDEQTVNIPIIMLSARHLQKEDKIKGLGIGAISFLTKPIDDVELLAHLNVGLRIRKAEDKLREIISSLEKNVRVQIKKLIDSEKQFQFVAENLQEGLWITDRNDDFIYFNKAMEIISGVKNDDILGLNFEKDLPKETTKNLLPFFNKTKKNLKSIPYEIDVVSPEERNSVQSGWLIPKMNKGKYDGMICTVIDISEKRAAEKNLLKKIRDLERINNLSIDRELKMISLKKEINNLLREAGKQKKYSVI